MSGLGNIPASDREITPTSAAMSDPANVPGGAQATVAACLV